MPCAICQRWIEHAWLQWCLCECEPAPSWIKRFTFDTYNRKWYFICNECPVRHPEYRDYVNINIEGAPSTGSESGDDESL